MTEWASYLLEIRSHAEDWRRRFERELHWYLDDGLILEPHARRPAGLFEVREVDAVRAMYDGPLWDTPVCPFVGARRAFLAFSMESTPLARRFGYDAGRAARGFVLDLGRPTARRASPLVHRTVEHTLALIDLERLHGYGATRSGLYDVMKYGSDMLVLEDGPYVDYVVAELARLAKTSDATRDYGDVEIWRYTASFTGGSECYLFE